MRVEHGAVCPWRVKRVMESDTSTMEGCLTRRYSQLVLNVQARGGGGVAERLHVSCGLTHREH